MSNRKIRKVAVLGSGVMGSRIACHFAGVGLQVLLLDIVPKEAEGSTDKNTRNKIVNEEKRIKRSGRNIESEQRKNQENQENLRKKNK